MAEIVAAKMFVAELSDDLVPVRRVAEDRGADATTPWPGEQPSLRIISVDGCEPSPGDIIETGTDSYRLAQTRARAEQAS
ncbi:hypothetical protein ABZ815_38215 [Nonomuraea sp. NPDC047529]|uniref:hypothetical protein n=1 Tax=Nonomuraea sp. NPDC047529 TaxID=3155623 RepID=UPI00340853C0